MQSIQEYVPQAVPFRPIQVKQDESIPAGAVDGQETGPAIQRDNVQIPAKIAVTFFSIRDAPDLQMTL
jgi:hypothetical protein